MQFYYLLKHYVSLTNVYLSNVTTSLTFQSIIEPLQKAIHRIT